MAKGNINLPFKGSVHDVMSPTFQAPQIPLLQRNPAASLPQIAKPRPDPRAAVQALLAATGGDWHAQNPDPAPRRGTYRDESLAGTKGYLFSTDEDPFYGDSVASQTRRAQVFGEADADLEDMEAERAGARALRVQPYAESVADTSSERAAGREFFPSASRLYDRTRGAATQDAYNRYVAPAQIGAQADLDAASIAGDSRIRAARERARKHQDVRSLIMSGLTKAAEGQMSGGKFDPEQMNQLLQFLIQSAGVFEQPR